MALDDHCNIEGDGVQEVRDHVTVLMDTLAALEAVLETVWEVLQLTKRVLRDQVKPVVVWFTIGYSLVAVVLLSALSSLVATWPVSTSLTPCPSVCWNFLAVTSVCGAITFACLSLLLFLAFFIALVR